MRLFEIIFILILMGCTTLGKHQEGVSVCVIGGDLSGKSGKVVDYDEDFEMYEIALNGTDYAVMIEEEFISISGCN